MGTSLIARRRCLLWPLAWAASQAHALDTPKGRPVLSVTGRISQRNGLDIADFDLEMLAALPQHSFSTRTPWDKTPRKFTGPLLRDLLASVGAQGKLLKAAALNDYKVEIPVEDAQLYDVIICHLIDDQPMRIRDRGPLFIVYPFDAYPAIQSGRYFSRAIWQLRRIDVQ
jgi:hypothetical protein